MTCYVSRIAIDYVNYFPIVPQRDSKTAISLPSVFPSLEEISQPEAARRLFPIVRLTKIKEIALAHRDVYRRFRKLRIEAALIEFSH